MGSIIIISKIQKVSSHGSTLYVYVPRSCYHIVSADSILYAYLAEDVDGSTAIVYSADSPSPEPRSVIVVDNKIVLLPSRKAMVYKVKVARCSKVLALRIPKPFARILGINPKDYVNIVCYDDKIIVKPVPHISEKAPRDVHEPRGVSP